MAKNRDELSLQKLGKEIRRLKEARGITDLQLAKLAGIGSTQVWRLLEGQVNPTYSTLKAIAKVLDVHPRRFL